MFKTAERLSKGTFKKCDMHVHSSSCYSRAYSEEDFFERLLNGDLDVVAVTDHNVIDVNLLKRLQCNMAEKGKTLIAGAELNIRLKDSTIETYGLTLGKGKKGSYFHVIVWFAVEQAAVMSEIVRKLFAAQIISKDAEKGSDAMLWDERRLLALPSKQFSRHTEGLAINLEDFQSAVAKIPHFLVPHENKERSLSDYLPNSANGVKLAKNEEYKDRLFYYSSAMAVEGGSTSRRFISEALARELETTVASLLFSDAHSIEQIGSKYTWIDFDGDLDSLLLAVSDPESRIRTSDEQDSLPQTNTASFLESVTFNTIEGGDKTKAHEQTINFSPGYNGIVGSRGSGKTLLARVLAGKPLDDYAQLIDSDSIQFKQHNGISTRNLPALLYLGQGELESIFRNDEYWRIPFLNDRVSPQRQLAEVETRNAQSQLDEILELEHSLLKSFCEKYPQGPRSIDHLNTKTPSGIAIGSPVYPSDEYSKIEKSIGYIEESSSCLARAESLMGHVKLDASFPENDALFSALTSEAETIREDIASLIKRAKRFTDVLNECDPDLFECRKRLVSLYNSILIEFNSKEDSTTLSQYNESAKAANSFMDDLLELRIALRHLDDEAEAAFSKMLYPIEPIEFSDGSEAIEVSFAKDADTSFSDKVSGLLPGKTEQSSQSLVRAFLYQHDKQKMHKLFNGTRMKASSGKGVIEHYEKYFQLLSSDVKAASDLRTVISIGGQQIDTMSPGMKAQALMKLFLDDKAAEGEAMYIVIDQPEDNLDVATIKNFLVERIKSLKLNVQFFVVSHSAPVIVNGDARTVVVCESNDGIIRYSSGPMNDQKIKQKIATVLDGGERYLKMRLNKYNFQVGDQR